MNYTLFLLSRLRQGREKGVISPCVQKGLARIQGEESLFYKLVNNINNLYGIYNVKPKIVRLLSGKDTADVTEYSGVSVRNVWSGAAGRRERRLAAVQHGSDNHYRDYWNDPE